MKPKNKEVYATMITPYKNGKVDYEAVRELTRWYWKEGCDGIFASCLSSEIFHLSLEDRVRIVREVVAVNRELSERDRSRAPMVIVASGHISSSFEDQVEELRAIAAEAPDALILITNRLDIENKGDDQWIREMERLVAKLPEDIDLGVYECPVPFKRLLTEKTVKWCASNKRFKFIKDTSCDRFVMAMRTEWCKGSDLKIYNANSQTLLDSVEVGVDGYCGIMANFSPSLYSTLLSDRISSEEKYILQSVITAMSALVESTDYPCSAKYYLAKHERIEMEASSRSRDVNISEYQRDCIDQLAYLINTVKAKIAKINN